MREHFALEPGITFLNHGSFGATPRVVLARQRALQDQMESQPLRFMMRELPGLLNDARDAVATFVGARSANLVFVNNATAGVNAVLRSLRWSPGDELLTTSHAYNACANALHFVAQREGARVVVADVPFPLLGEAQVIEAVLAKVTPQTRLALIDHVTSPTGVVWPIETLVKELEARGVMTLVDGAHAPGMLPLNLEALGASFYTANLHKWVCGPKGAALLFVREDRQPLVRPLSISHGANQAPEGRSRFHLEFDWTGTDDFTAWLSVPAAIDFMQTLMPGGWPAVQQHNRALVLEARRLVNEALGLTPVAPESMLGSMAAVILPGVALREGSLPGSSVSDPLREWLFHEHDVEVSIFAFGSHRVMRFTAQVYNQRADYERLAALVKHWQSQPA